MKMNTIYEVYNKISGRADEVRYVYVHHIYPSSYAETKYGKVYSVVDIFSEDQNSFQIWSTWVIEEHGTPQEFRVKNPQFFI